MNEHEEVKKKLKEYRDKEDLKRNKKRLEEYQKKEDFDNKSYLARGYTVISEEAKMFPGKSIDKVLVGRRIRNSQSGKRVGRSQSGKRFSKRSIPRNLF